MLNSQFKPFLVYCWTKRHQKELTNFFVLHLGDFKL